MPVLFVSTGRVVEQLAGESEHRVLRRVRLGGDVAEGVVGLVVLYDHRAVHQIEMVGEQ